MSERIGSGIEVLFRRLPSAEDLPAPQRATRHSSGYDLRAGVDETVEISPGQRALIPTGIAIELPEGLEGQVRPRSGLAVKRVLNAPGTIDSDYRGEIKVVLINLGTEPVRIERGDRIAQLVIARLPHVEMREATALTETERGAGGFGHTGNR